MNPLVRVTGPRCACGGRRPLPARGWSLALLAGLALGVGAAGAQSGERDAARRVLALVADASCQDDSDCRSAPFGASACGGPESFVAWSTRSTDAGALAQALRQHAAERERSISARAEASICIEVQDPGAQCQRSAGSAAGRCMLRPRGAPGLLR